MPDQLHIFISYARKDARDLALRLRGDLIAHGYDVWLDTAEIEGGASWSNAIETAIDRCDVALVLLSPGSYHSEICRAEQLRSLRKGKRVVPLLLQADSERPLHLEHLNYRNFSQPSQYPAALQTLLRDIENGETRPLPDIFRETFNNAPPLPPNFVQRPDELAQLRRAVVGEGGSRQIALTALRGMGGIGKSVLAAALCQDEVVQGAFPDGIFWIEIGHEPRELVSRMAQLGARLGDDPKLYSTLETSQDNLRNLLRIKAALIVLDDVWDAKVVNLFKANAPRCRILFTTRDGTIAQRHDAQELHLGTMTPAQSLEFLRARAGRTDPRLAEIAEQLGHLPLALKLASAHLGEGMSCAEWLANFQHVAQIKLDRRSTDPHENLQICFDLSVQRLSEADQPLYYALGIFAQDVAIPIPVAQLLWRKLEPKLTEHDCRELLTELDRLELLERHPDNTLILHDLLQDYCHAALAEQAASTHAALLAAYNPQTQAWPTIPHDGYLYYHLIYHLIEADRQEEAQRLLRDYGWLHAKLNATDVNALANDYVFLTTNLHRASPLCLIRDAIRLSTHILNRFPSQLAAQLIGRLQSWDLPEIRQLLTQTEQAQTTPWLHPLCGSLTSPGSALVRTLVGHQGAINAVAVLPDSSRLISGSEDKTLKVWDLTTGIELRTLTGHTAEVVAVAAWPNGKWVASGDYDGVIIVWDIETGAALWSAAVDADYLTGLAVLPDGRGIIGASSDGRLRRWDLESGTKPYILAEELGEDNQLALLPDGQSVVTISSDAPITVWDVGTGSIVLRFGEDTTEPLGNLAIFPDGRRMISSHGDDPVRVWNLETGEEIRSLTGDKLSVNQVAITVDGRRAIAAVEDGTLLVWNVDTGEQEVSLAGHVGETLAVAVTPDGRYAISGAGDRTLKVWDLSSTIESNLATTHDGELSYVGIVPDEQHAFSIAYERYVSRVAVMEGVSLQLPTVNAVSIFPDWKRYITTSYPHSMKIWRLDDGAEVEHVVRPIGDNEQDNPLSVQDFSSGKELLTLKGHTRSVTTIAIMPDGNRALSASEDATLRVWDLSTGENLLTMPTPSGGIMSAAIMPDNRHTISATQDGMLRVWDLDEGTELYTLTGHTGRVSDVVVTADGQYAISGSFDGTVRVWDLSERQEIGMLGVDIGIVTTIAMTVDERFLLAGTHDGTLWVWDLQQGKLVANFTCESCIVACDMGAMSQAIVVGEQSGRLHFLRLENA